MIGSRLRPLLFSLSLPLAFLGAMVPDRAAAACAEAPEPILTLAYGSRYKADSTTRSDIDAATNAEVDKELDPVDSFLRDLTESANQVFAPDTDQKAVANCVISQIAVWAAANALADLQSDGANLTIGSRLAGFALVLLQVLPFTDRADEVATIKDWLGIRMNSQMEFWESRAPDGARQGNLRAWAAMGASAAAGILGDQVMQSWAVWSVAHILCTAEPDGSLPQEMSRGKFALKYQLHATAPLVTATLLLKHQGIDLSNRCDGALDRIVAFGLQDIASGTNTKGITGKKQSFFDGSDKLEGFHLAWLEAYLLLDSPASKDAARIIADQFRPLSYSKLGGKQAALWQALR